MISALAALKISVHTASVVREELQSYCFIGTDAYNGWCTIWHQSLMPALAKAAHHHHHFLRPVLRQVNTDVHVI